MIYAPLLTRVAMPFLTRVFAWWLYGEKAEETRIGGWDGSSRARFPPGPGAGVPLHLHWKYRGTVQIQ